MPWLTEFKLKQLGKKAEPDVEFRHRLRTRLCSEIGLKPVIFPIWKMAVSGATVLFLAISGTGVYAYTSPSVLPETPLYTVRLALEKIEEKTAILPNWRAKVVIKHLEKRISENEILKQKNKPITDERVRMFGKNLRQAMDKTESLPEKQKKSTDRVLDQLEMKHENMLSNEKKSLERTLKQEREKIKERIQKMDEKRKEHFKRILERDGQRINRN